MICIIDCLCIFMARNFKHFLSWDGPRLKVLTLMISINNSESKKRKKTGSFLHRGEKAVKGNLPHSQTH